MGKLTPIQKAHKKVKAHHATKVGAMATALGSVGTLSHLLADLYFEVDERTAAEVQFLLVHLHKFSQQARQLQGIKAQTLQKALQGIHKTQQLLKDVDEGGYESKRLARDAFRDLTLVKRVQANLQDRTREAAFILAELEQQVDPLPGLRIASAQQRAENAKRQKKARALHDKKRGKLPEQVAPPPPEEE